MDKNANIDTIIESASKDEANEAALLTFMAYKDFSYDMFGTDDDEKVVEYYRKLWRHEDNRFSYRYSFIAKADSAPVGLMTCYSADLTKKLVYPTIKYLIKLCGVRFIWHIITHIGYFYAFAKTVEACPDEFYIGTLAVLPEYRGYGIGAKLLEHMRALAGSRKLYKCALLVEASNEGGIRFYEKNGFKKMSYSEKPRAYFKMVNEFQ